MGTITVKFPAHYAKQAKQFFDSYTEENLLIGGWFDLKKLKDRAKRVCRFCQKRAGETTFIKDAHVLPYGLGNKYLISDFECDQCNEKFGRYEDALMNCLGVTRTVCKTQGRSKIPKFKFHGVNAMNEEILNIEDAIKIQSDNPESTFLFDFIQNRQSIKYRKPSYIPLNVYKAFLKMALCAINEEDLHKYAGAFKFLTTTELDKGNKGFILFGYRLPSAYKDVFGILFKKVNPDRNETTHSFVLFYGYFMFQIFLPFCSNDYKYYNGYLDHPLFPPLFDGSGDNKLVYVEQIVRDLSSTEIEKNDEETLNFYFDKGAFDNVVSVDPVTRKISDNTFDPTNIAGIYIVDSNQKFNLE